MTVTNNMRQNWQQLSVKSNNPDFKPFYVPMATSYQGRRANYDYARVEYTFEYWAKSLQGEASNDPYLSNHDTAYFADEYRQAYEKFLDKFASIEADKRQKDEHAVRIALYHANVANETTFDIASYANDMISDYEHSAGSIVSSVLQENLEQALKLLEKGYGKTPDQHMVQIKSGKYELQLTATNGSMWLQTGVTYAPGLPVNIFLPAKRLQDLVKALPAFRIDMNTTTREVDSIKHLYAPALHLVSGCASANVIGTRTPKKVREMPALPIGDYILINDVIGFRSKLEQALAITAKNDRRPILECVNLKIENNTLSIVAADGWRLSVDKIEVESGDIAGNWNLHNTDIRALLAILPAKNAQSTLTLSTAGECMFFVYDRVIACFTAVKGKFPDYDQIIPRQPAMNVALNLNDTIRQIKSLKPFYKESANTVKIEIVQGTSGNIYHDPATVTLSATSQEKGSRTVELRAGESTGNIKASVNGAYLLEILEKMAKALPKTKSTIEPSFLLSLSDQAPWKIDSWDAQGCPGTTYVIMPMSEPR